MPNYATGHFIQNVDTVVSRYAVSTNAAELLRKFGYGHIRSYGVGGVTTPSFRGTGASHTAVLWNGINIISPLIGQSDLSLLPVNFVDDVQLQSGGSASLYGSGAIGGTIQFNNKAVFRQGFTASLNENIGSFKTFFHGLSATWSEKRWISSTKVFQGSAENNFPYFNNNVLHFTTRKHNASEQHGVLQQNYFQINQKQLLSIRFWFQDNHIEIPEPTTVTGEGEATQRDKFFRSMIGWNYDYKNGHLFIQSAQVHHLLDYRNPAAKVTAPSTFDSFINTFENTVDVAKDLEWTSGANYTHEIANGDGLNSTVPQRNRVALYTAFKHQTSKWTNVLSARQEIVNGQLTPFAPSLGVEYRVHPIVGLFGNVSRNYRIPTFNDLYWRDATSEGNPGLKMETSWSEEVGVKLQYQQFKGQAAFFSNQVDDMIYWGQTAGKWSPTNLRKAWTRGIESFGTLTKVYGKFSYEIIGRYSYTRATTEAVYDPHKQKEIGNQLVYTPRNESSETLRLSWKLWHLQFTHTYTGRQYTDDANNVFVTLDDYQLANLWISKDMQLKHLTILVMIEANNLFDQQVEVRRGYPIPGTNFKAGLTIRFNKPSEP